MPTFSEVLIEAGVYERVDGAVSVGQRVGHELHDVKPLGHLQMDIVNRTC